MLHYACQGGSVSLVETLIRKHKAGVYAIDDNTIYGVEVLPNVIMSWWGGGGGGGGVVRVVVCLSRGS